MNRQLKQAMGMLIWVAAALAVGVYVYYDRAQKKETKEKEEHQTLLLQLDQKLRPSEEKDRNILISEITRLEIFNGTEDKASQTIVLERQDKKSWVVSHPIRTPADEQEVQFVLRDLVQAQEKQSVHAWEEKDARPNDKLKEFGLEQPHHKASFLYKQQTYTLWFGHKNKFADQYYVYIPTKRKIALAETSLFNAINKKLFAMRRKEIFSQRVEDIQNLSITRASDQLAFEKRSPSIKAPIHAHEHDHDHSTCQHGHDHKHAHGKKHDPKHAHGKTPPASSKTQWYMLLPTRAWADTREVDSLISSLRYLRASSFVSEDAKKDAAKFGLDKPRISVEISFKDNTRAILNIAYKQEGTSRVVYAAADVGGPIAQIGDYILKDLQKNAFAFRDTKILEFANDSVYGVRIQAAQTFQLMRIKDAQDTWSVYAPSPERADLNKVTKLFNDLGALKTQEFVREDIDKKDYPQYGLDQPQSSYLLFGSNAKNELDALHIGKKTDKGFYATNKAGNKIFLLKESDLKDLPQASWQLIVDGKPPAPPAKPTPRQPIPAPTTKPADQPTIPTSAPAVAPTTVPTTQPSN